MFFTLLDVLRLFFLTMEIILLGNNRGNNSIFVAFCGLSGFLLLVSWLVHASFVRMRQIADYY